MKRKYQLIFLLFIFSLFVLSSCSSSSKSTISITKKYSPKELEEDLNFLINTDEQVHPNLFVHTPKVIFDSMITSIRKKINKPMTSLEFYKITVPAISKLRDGHTSLWFPYKFRQKYLDDGGKIIPFDIHIKGQKIFVRKNYTSDSTLTPNSEIISINSVKAQDILKSLRNYTFGEFETFQNDKI